MQSYTPDLPLTPLGRSFLFISILYGQHVSSFSQFCLKVYNESDGHRRKTKTLKAHLSAFFSKYHHTEWRHEGPCGAKGGIQSYSVKKYPQVKIQSLQKSLWFYWTQVLFLHMKRFNRFSKIQVEHSSLFNSDPCYPIPQPLSSSFILIINLPFPHPGSCLQLWPDYRKDHIHLDHWSRGIWSYWYCWAHWLKVAYWSL